MLVVPRYAANAGDWSMLGARTIASRRREAKDSRMRRSPAADQSELAMMTLRSCSRSLASSRSAMGP